MQRRRFMQQSAMAGASLLTATMARANMDRNKAAEAPFHLNYAIHDGMFKNSAGADFIDQLKYAYDLGFRAMEDNGMTSRTADMQEKIGNAMAKLGMKMGVFVLDKGGNGANSLATGKPEYTEIFLKGCRQAVEVAKRVNATWITVVPGDFDRSRSVDMQMSNVITAMRKGAEILEPHNIVMVLEPLSDTPDLFLRGSDQTYLICKAVNSPSCKILYDMYHMQRNQGDIIKHMNDAWDEIAYFQIGDNPGRNEPGTGEMNYKNIFKHIYEKGYKGVLGMEHGIAKPGKEGEAALVKAYREADDFA
ncbi:MAG: TIM barrel protein [Bacteroidota bacterium]|nr:TIM barrel protein [Bacteroidota bacterium]